MKAILRPALGSALLFAIAALGGIAAVSQTERLRARDEREAASQAAAGAAFSLEQEVARSMSATYALAAILGQRGHIDDFETLASQMLPLYGGLSALQLAPGGVIRQIHPLAGNEAALGHDLLRDPDRRFQATEAIRARRLVVAGPFELKQGGVGLVGRLPVFLPDPRGVESERFWGFVTALVRLPALVQASRLGQLAKAGYGWELSRTVPERGVRQRFAESAPGELRDPVALSVTAGDGEWRLAVAPAGGWRSGRRLVLQYALALALAGCLAVLAFIVLRQPEVLRREVEARTRQLAEANARLAADAAEREREAERLRDSQRLESVGRLAGGIAHDFNNLLTVILSCSSALKEDLRAGLAADAEHVEEIHAAGERARDLTRQLLAFARKQVIAPVPLDLNTLVRGSEKLLRRVLGEDVELDVTLEPSLSAIRCDPGQLEQVILNLAVNARDAMPSGGRLTLETADVQVGEERAAAHPGLRPGPYVRLAIRDSGHGMTPEVKARLFEPFFTTKAQGKGTGLGLATVYGIVKQSEGYILVESDPGRGASFEIYFPQTLEAPAGAPAREARPPAARGTESVLLVEDDPQVRQVTARSLRSGGYRVLVAASGSEALQVAAREAEPLDLLVTDVIMPGLDGRAVADALRRDRPALRVLFVSGHPQNVIAKHGVLEPGVELLPKPFAADALLARVRAALDARASPSPAPRAPQLAERERRARARAG